MLQRVASFYLENDTSDPTSYQIMRILKWGKVVKTPINDNGVMKIPGPPKAKYAYLKKLFLEEQWLDLLKQAEGVFTRPGLHFWLDLQFYTYRSLSELGGKYIRCSEIIANEVSSLLERAPGLKNLEYMDKTPFAGAEALQWMETLEQNSSSKNSMVDGNAEGFIHKEEQEAIQNLMQENKLSEALRMVESGNHSFSTTERVERIYYMASLCSQKNNYRAAQGLLTSLESSSHIKGLLDSDSKIGFKVYHLMVKNAKKLLADNKKNSD